MMIFGGVVLSYCGSERCPAKPGTAASQNTGTTLVIRCLLVPTE